MDKSVDTDQPAPYGGVWPGSTLFYGNMKNQSNVEARKDVSGVDFQSFWGVMRLSIYFSYV